MPDNWDFSTQRRAQSEPSTPIITYGLCALCVIMTFAFWNMNVSPAVARIGAFVSPSSAQIWDGAYFGLFTTFFAHGDIIHLLFNMSMLVQLGRVMEPSLPPWAYILFLAASAAISMGCQIAIMGDAGVGASGVVYAMFGLMWAMRARYRSWTAVATRQNMTIFVVWGVFCIVGTYMGFMHVANVAHGSGILFGLAVGYLYMRPHQRGLWAMPVAAMTVLTALSLFWLPWSAEWNYYHGDKAFDAKQYRTAIGWYHRSLRLGGSRYYNWENIKRAWGNLARDAAIRKDPAALEEAERQIESAERLEGPDPSKAPDTTGPAGLHEVKPK